MPNPGQSSAVVLETIDSVQAEDIIKFRPTSAKSSNQQRPVLSRGPEIRKPNPFRFVPFRGPPHGLSFSTTTDKDRHRKKQVTQRKFHESTPLRCRKVVIELRRLTTKSRSLRRPTPILTPRRWLKLHSEPRNRSTMSNRFCPMTWKSSNHDQILECPRRTKFYYILRLY